MKSKISLSRLVPPLIKSLAIRWKFVFPLVEQSISSGSGAAAIVYLILVDCVLLPDGHASSLGDTKTKITEIFAEIITWIILK